jgi:hypothetical protein
MIKKTEERTLGKTYTSKLILVANINMQAAKVDTSNFSRMLFRTLLKGRNSNKMFSLKYSDSLKVDEWLSMLQYLLATCGLERLAYVWQALMILSQPMPAIEW